MAGFASHDTQRLTRSSLELVATRGRHRRLLAAVLAAILVLAGATAIRNDNWLPGAPRSVVDLQDQNLRLRDDMERLRLELDMERATRAELERQNRSLTERVTELTKQIEFVNSRTSRKSAASRPAGPAKGNHQG